MARPDFTRISGTTLTQHALRPPKRTALVWCRICGARHRGHCNLVRVPARTRQGAPVHMPTFRRASWTARKRRTV